VLEASVSPYKNSQLRQSQSSFRKILKETSPKF
jgi:hypothetical protein